MREARSAIEQAVRPTPSVTARRCARRAAAGARPMAAPAFFDGLRTGDLQRPPRGQHGGAGRRRCCATRSASAPLDSYQIEYGKVGTPAVVLDDLDRGAHPRHRGAHPPDRRHQAPGQDGDRRHLPHRRDPARGRPGAEPSSRPARRAIGSATASLRTLADLDPAVAEVRRPHPLPHRGRRRRGRRPRDRQCRSRWHRQRPPVPHRSRPRACGAPSTRSPSSGTVLRRPRPQRRPHRSCSCPRSRTT